MREIKDYQNILTTKGIPNNPGYAYRNYFIYNRNNIHTVESRIKEWEFYQFNEGDWILQFTIGHASLFDSLDSELFNLKTGKRYGLLKLKLHIKNQFKFPNTEKDHLLEYHSKNYNIRFELKNSKRILDVECSTKQFKKAHVHCVVDNIYDNDKMNILTPFKENKYQFFLNYKENYYHAEAVCDYDNEHFEFKNLKGLIDSGRGYWPYEQEWIWSNMTATINGVDIGWNLGYGFGDLSNATENMVFVNHKGYQLGEITTTLDWNDTFKPLSIKDKNDHLYVELSPIYDNVSKTKVLWIDNICHQVFFYAKGYINVDNKKIEFKDVVCFLEHAHNHW